MVPTLSNSYCVYCKRKLTKPIEIFISAHKTCQFEMEMYFVNLNAFELIKYYLLNQQLIEPDYVEDETHNSTRILSYCNEDYDEERIIKLIFETEDSTITSAVLEASHENLIRELLSILETTNLRSLQMKYRTILFPPELFKLKHLEELSFERFWMSGTHDIDFKDFRQLRNLKKLDLKLHDSFVFENEKKLFKLGKIHNITAIKTEELHLTNTWIHKEFKELEVKNLSITAEDDELWKYDLYLENIPYQLEQLTLEIHGKLICHGTTLTVTELNCSTYVEKEKRIGFVEELLLHFPALKTLNLLIRTYGDENILLESEQFIKVRNYFRIVCKKIIPHHIAFSIKIDYYAKKRGLWTVLQFKNYR